MQYVMSALPPKAEMCGATKEVRFVPIADIPEDSCHSEMKQSADAGYLLRGQQDRTVTLIFDL